MFEVIFDLETKKFFDETGNNDPSQLGVSILSLYRREVDQKLNEVRGEMKSFWENEFENMWKIFWEADRIIGFNSLKFDIPALKPYSPANFDKLPHFDILDKIRELQGHRVSLNAISQDTLDKSKTDVPENAGKYWQKGDPESLTLLRSYCEADVALTKEIYDFGLKYRFLKYRDFWNNQRVVAVDFSYPEETVSKQTVLF